VNRMTPTQVFEHVLKNAVSIPLSLTLYADLTQQGISTMPDLFTLDVSQFLSLPRVAYSLGYTNWLSVIIAFNSDNVFHNGGYTVDYKRVDRDMLTYFQATHYNPSMTYGHHPPPNTRPTHAGHGRVPFSPWKNDLITSFVVPSRIIGLSHFCQGLQIPTLVTTCSIHCTHLRDTTGLELSLPTRPKRSSRS
jgi:hypothetical protein